MVRQLMGMGLVAAMTLAGCAPKSGPVAVLPGGGESPLASQGGGWSLRLVRPDGGHLNEIPYRGGTFVEGIPGERYAVRVDNPTGRRVEAVITVDGRDVLTGELGDFVKHRGYVIQPYGHVVVEGFRQSMDEVATFRFTTPEDSYSARMGSPQHVGVVGVALFAESAPPPAPIAAPASRFGDDYAAPAAEAAPGAGAMDEGRARKQGSNIGTGYGETRFSAVTEVPFERGSAENPDVVLALYYDDRQGLIDRGILAPAPSYDPQPFPAQSDRRFAPPPPRD